MKPVQPSVAAREFSNLNHRTASPTVDEFLLQTDNSAERREFVAGNCEKLADFLEQLPPGQFNMRHWCIALQPNNECGTAACAMGWAAMSGIFDGLDWVPQPGDKFAQSAPTVNGGETTHSHAGRLYFGEYVASEIFEETELKRPQVIIRLRAFAQETRAMDDIEV